MQDVVSKWGKRVAERGFSQVPNYLLQINMFVTDEKKLPPVEMVILLQLVSSWWKKDEMPFLAMRTLADRTGISERQVQRAIKSLEEKGFFEKKRKAIKGIIASNSYDLTPLVEILNTIDEHFINKHPRNIKDSEQGQPTKQTLRRIKKPVKGQKEI
jgi:DNA-binding transcriptional regulator YhcF (GntR family)